MKPEGEKPRGGERGQGRGRQWQGHPTRSPHRKRQGGRLLDLRRGGKNPRKKRGGRCGVHRKGFPRTNEKKGEGPERFHRNPGGSVQNRLSDGGLERAGESRPSTAGKNGKLGPRKTGGKPKQLAQGFTSFAIQTPSRFKNEGGKVKVETDKTGVIFAVFEFFRIIFRGVVACHVGGGKRARDRDVNRQPFPF